MRQTETEMKRFLRQSQASTSAFFGGKDDLNVVNENCNLKILEMKV